MRRIQRGHYWIARPQAAPYRTDWRADAWQVITDIGKALVAVFVLLLCFVSIVAWGAILAVQP